MSEQAHNPQDLTQGPVHTHLVRLTGFMLLGFVSVMGANLMESVYLGLVGTNELAGLGFTFPLVMTMQGITMGLSIGASSVVARRIGNGDWLTAKRLITHCFVLAAILIAVVIVLVWISLEPLFELLGANETILPMSVGYMKVWLVGLPFFAVAMVASTLMRAAGDAKTPGYLMTVGSTLQILLGPFFIFGLAGFPELGLAGAAVAFVIARFVSLIMYSWVMLRGGLLAFDMTGFPASCREILHVGLPAIATNLISPVGMSVVTRLLAGHGTVVVAGFSVASRIEVMVMMIIFALSMSVAPFVGQNWGRGHVDRVEQALRQANWFALGWGVFSYLVLVAFGSWFVGVINSDPEVIEAASWYLLISPLAIGAIGVLQNSTSSFNALGKPLPPLVLALLQMILLGIPMALFGNYLFGYPGIFAGFVLTVSVLSIVSWFWIRRTISTEPPVVPLETGNV